MSKRVTLTLPDMLAAQLAGAATARGLNVQQYIMFSLVESMPKQVTAKPLTVRADKAAREATRKATVQATFRARLAEGQTSQEILASCTTWRDEAGRWLAEVVNEAQSSAERCELARQQDNIGE
jgi:hypothetical protein